MAMFDKVMLSGWLFAFALIVFPCTIIAQSSTPTAGEIWKEPITGIEFVWVPGGCYEMGEYWGRPLDYWLTIAYDLPIEILCQEKPVLTLLAPYII
jgi:hypothetical protein